MKQIFSSGAFVAVMALGTAGAAETQTKPAAQVDEELPTAGIFIEPLLAIFGFYEGDINVTLDERTAIGVWGQYFDYTVFGTGITGYGVGVGVPLFLTGRVYHGLYLYPLLKYQGVHFEAGDTTASISYYGPQVTVGYQWNWSGFSLKVGGGLEYTLGGTLSDEFNTKVAFQGIGTELDFAIGGVF